MLYDTLAVVAVCLVIPVGIWILWQGRSLTYRCQWKTSWEAHRVNFCVSLAGVYWMLLVMPGLGMYFLFGFFPQLGVHRAIPVFVMYAALARILTLMLKSNRLVRQIT